MQRFTFILFCISCVLLLAVGLVCLQSQFNGVYWIPSSSTLRRKGNDLLSPSSNHHPNVTVLDRIYNPPTEIPIGAFVLEEYKLIFVTIPKVACTEWKRMFMRMTENPHWCNEDINVHYPEINHVPYLSQYSIEEATAMMISPEWTKAVFVREPKERVLSAFLDKAVYEKSFFKTKCCRNLKDDHAKQDCIRDMTSFPSFLHYVTNYPTECWNPHWEAQTSKIDSKWWPYFNFIGYHHNLQQDAKRLLSQLISSRDGMNAWDKLGSTGWGEGDGCENRSGAFLQTNTATHQQKSGEKMKQYYEAETETLVEKYWEKDWTQAELQFPPVKLYTTF